MIVNGKLKFLFRIIFDKLPVKFFTGSWSSKQPGQVFDVIPIGIKLVCFVWRHWLGRALTLMLAVEPGFVPN